MQQVVIAVQLCSLVSILTGSTSIHDLPSCRRRSRAGFLRFYLAISTITVLPSLSCAVSSSSTLEVIQNPTEWETKKFELIETFLFFYSDCWCRCSRSAL
uniref:Uncharacterized protein n=1 Tax=Salix viminalis TaxID=40686 RepID=A0A6N2LPF4_SALVM